jgi:hypothetical protein
MDERNTAPVIDDLNQQGTEGRNQIIGPKAVSVSRRRPRGGPEEESGLCESCLQGRYVITPLVVVGLASAVVAVMKLVLAAFYYVQPQIANVRSRGQHIRFRQNTLCSALVARWRITVRATDGPSAIRILLAS